MRTDRPAGVTLVELLVGLALTALITTMLVQLLGLAARSWQKTDERAATLQSALVVVTRMREEVRDSSPDGMCIVSGQSTDATGQTIEDDALLLVSWRGMNDTELQWDPSGQIVWQTLIACYLDPVTQRVLLRQRALMSLSVDASQPTAADLTPQAGDLVQVLAHEIESLSFTHQGIDAVGLTVQAGTGANDCVLNGGAMPTVPSTSQSTPSPTPTL